MEHAQRLDPLGNASDCFRTPDAECYADGPRGVAVTERRGIEIWNGR